MAFSSTPSSRPSYSLSLRSHSNTNSKNASSKRPLPPSSSPSLQQNHYFNDSVRVRVAVRLRPRNSQDAASDADFADSVELQPELKRLILKKNNWDSESYKFDEVFSETASQKRVYEVVAKPVVESVLSGYNGTVMAYGQTGTGKTYTVGRLGKDDASQRGIMVRAVEDIIASINPAFDIIEVSYLQFYMEVIQDMLAPERTNILINEDPRTGEVTVPGATLVKIRDLSHFLELLQIGEANRHAANTRQNTESSRSHAVLMVLVRRSINQELEGAISSQGRDVKVELPGGTSVPKVRKSKLLIVDLAGSERIDKSGFGSKEVIWLTIKNTSSYLHDKNQPSTAYAVISPVLGSEGHLLEEAKFINLSLTSLGKCINALAENSPHIPTRDSKLTRLLRDSFGGTARTSLIVTIGPSARHHAETTSTIMFGQRAMKIMNMVKLKQEFDYESLCRKLEIQVDNLTSEIERQQRLREHEKSELETKLKQCQESFSFTNKNLVSRSEALEKDNSRLELKLRDILNELDSCKVDNDSLHDKITELEMRLKHSQQQQLENSTYQKVLADTTQMYEKKISELIEQMEDEQAHCKRADEQLDLTRKLFDDQQKLIQQYEAENSTYQKALAETNQMYEKKIVELSKQLEDAHSSCESAEEQLDLVKKHHSNCYKLIQQHEVESSTNQKALVDTTQMYEMKILDLAKKLENEHALLENTKEQLDQAKKLLADQRNSMQELENMVVLKEKLQEMHQLYESSQTELQSVKLEYNDLLQGKATLREELSEVKRRLLVEEKLRKSLEHELAKLRKIAPETDYGFEDKKSYIKENIGKGSTTFGTPTSLHKPNPVRETTSAQRATIAKICEEVGLQKILQLLSSEDIDVQIHVVKVIANLAAEDGNQEKIVEEGGLDALLMLLKSSQNTTILRVASGAIANLAMNEMNQVLIMSKGGAQLLAKTANKTDDPQTLRMVSGALANLCGNENLNVMLKEDGGLKALLGMANSRNIDVIAQVARGMANFAKCESRGIIQGRKKGRSLLIEDGVLEWLIANSHSTSASTRRHVELALCHLAQNEDNVRDFISCGAAKELARIAVESSREDIRNLAKKTLKLNPKFQAEMQPE